MAYIELHQALFDHRKTIIAAALLEVQEVHLVGHLAALWSWCLDNAPDGILPDSSRVIARGARWIGDADALISGLTKAGFVERTDAGFVIHDWEHYGGKMIEKRRANAAKQARYRERHADDAPPNNDVTVTKPSRDALEKSREEKRRVTKPPQSPKGDEYSADFEERFWAHYPKGRGSKQAAFRLWQRLSAADKAAAVAALPAFAAGSDWQRGFHSGPEVWLRGRMWENPPPATVPTSINGMPPEIARLPYNSAVRLKWENDHRRASA